VPLRPAYPDWAREFGYDILRLDTVLSMTSARPLYRSLDFEEGFSYDPNDIDMECSL